MTIKLDLNDKKFVTTGNKEGLSSDETIFHYFRDEMLITGNYRGGDILEGQIVGKYVSENEIELLFQCITKENELKSGCSYGKIFMDDKGKLRLSFEWNWLNGDKTGGESFYREV